MSTSRGDTESNVTTNRQLFCGELGTNESRLAEPLQISRDGIKIIDSTGSYPDTDALITSQVDVFLRVLTADCAPVLIWSNKKPLVAAVHSGWQGSELDILGKTLKLMCSDFRADITSLHVVIGPGLTRENFEVGPEFSQKFPPEYLCRINGRDRYLFDNNRFLSNTAIRLGVPETQIEVLPFCSYKNSELFYSHRRDKGTTGRMMSIIGINNR